MKWLQFLMCVFSLVLAPVGLTAQDKSDSKSSESDKSEQVEKASDTEDHRKEKAKIKKSFSELAAAIKKENFKEAVNHMTQKGKDDFVYRPIAEAIVFSKNEAMFEIDGDVEGGIEGDFEEEFDGFHEELEAQMEEIKKLLSKYKLDKISFDPKSIQDEKGYSAQLKKLKQEVKKVLAKADDQWEVVKQFRRNSPEFMPDLFNSKVKQVEFDNGKAYVHLEIQFEMPEAEAGVVIEAVSPPVAVRFQQNMGEWLYDGIDEKKTEALMKEFMKDMELMDDGGGLK